MADYFEASGSATNAPATNGTAQPAAANEDMGMDEISVGTQHQAKLTPLTCGTVNSILKC